MLTFQSFEEKLELLARSILTKHPVKALYGGKLRLLCPHILGTDEGGAYKTLTYQYRGESTSKPIKHEGSKDNWRCLALDRLYKIELAEGHWRTAPYSEEQTCIKNVLVQIDE